MAQVTPMSTNISALAGQRAQAASLVDITKLVAAYYSLRPDPAVPAQRVSFGTSGHRGTPFDKSFNEAHVLGITQAICLYRRGQRIDGPLFIGVVIDLDIIRSSGIRMGVDPMGGAGVHYWARIAERYKLDLTLVSEVIDPTFG